VRLGQIKRDRAGARAGGRVRARQRKEEEERNRVGKGKLEGREPEGGRDRLGEGCGKGA
jgi:hypothetical protein